MVKRLVLIYLGRKGAGPVYAFEMARALSLRCQLLCIISKDVSNRIEWLKLSEQSEMVSLYEIKTYNSISEFVWRSLFVWQYFKVVRCIDDFAPDIVYSPMGHFWEKFIIPYVHCRQRISTIHDVVLHRGEDSWVHRFSRFLFSYRVEKYVILSDIFKEEMFRRGIKKENVVVIPHAVFNQYNKKKILDVRTYYRLLFFGRIIKYKGLDILLQSMQSIIRKYPNVKLSIVGSGDVDGYGDLIQNCGANIEAHIGWVDDSDIEAYFSNVDFVVLPYIQASQSGVVSLAYSFGKPVIATRVGGLPAQVVENGTGMLISPGNVDELVDAIDFLLSNEEELIRMKNCSWEYASNHTWDTSAKILLSIFEK